MLVELRAGLAELRDLAHGLHPAVLSDRGLAHALSSLATRATVPVELHVDLPAERLPIADRGRRVLHRLRSAHERRQVRRGFARVGHGRARAAALEVEVGDDGVGGAALGSGSGLQGLRDRIAAVNGTLRIESEPAAGTVLRARLPV